MDLTRLAVLYLVLALAATACQAQERRSVKLESAEHVVVFRENGVYAVFPYMAKTPAPDGVYVSLATRVNPSHDDATGGTVVMRSTDGCRTWEVHQRCEQCFSPEAAGDLQAMRTADGTLVSVEAGWEYYPEAMRAELEAAGWDVASACPGLVAAESRHVAKVSHDNGETWSEMELEMPNPPGMMGFHGGIVTDQDVVLWPVYGATTRGEVGHSYVYRSADAGRTWALREIIADSRGELPMNETSLLDLGGGHILAFVRTGDRVDHMYRAESINGGITWGRLRDSGITGHPPDLLKLRNGHILLTYGYRHAPFGVRAVISKDGGETWGDEYVLRDDGVGGDLGYPLSTQLEDGTIFTTYYIRVAGGPAHVAGTLWREPE